MRFPGGRIRGMVYGAVLIIALGMLFGLSGCSANYGSGGSAYHSVHYRHGFGPGWGHSWHGNSSYRPGPPIGRSPFMPFPTPLSR